MGLALRQKRAAGLLTAIAAAALLATAFAFLPSSPVIHAQDAGDYVDFGPELDARAASLYAGIMCPQCAGQTISQSRSPIAQTMRGIVRERLLNGDTDAEIFAFMAEAFGDSVLASPPKRGAALTVWLIPPAAMAIGGIIVFIAIRALRSRPAPAPDGLAPPPAGGEPELESYLRLVDRELSEESGELRADSGR